MQTTRVSNLKDYKKKLKDIFRSAAGFGEHGPDVPYQESLGPEAAAEGLAALGFRAWDQVSITHTSCCLGRPLSVL